MATELTVIVVSYGGAALLRDCLQSIPRSAAFGAIRVIVVDNASPDDTPEMVATEFPWVGLIRSSVNGGFAAGNNIGLGASRGRFVMLLNPDAELMPGTLETCVDYLVAHDDVAVVAPKLLNPDGSLQFSLRKFPRASNAVFEALLLHRMLPRATARFAETIVDPHYYEAERPVEWASGAAFMARSSAFSAVGPLDERFFLYSEETDWFFRAAQAGIRAVYLPDAVVIHRSSEGRNPELMRHAVESRLLYARKHMAAPSAAVVRAVLAVGMAARLVVWAVLASAGNDHADSRSEAYRIGLSTVLGPSRTQGASHA